MAVTDIVLAAFCISKVNSLLGHESGKQGFAIRFRFLLHNRGTKSVWPDVDIGWKASGLKMSDSRSCQWCRATGHALLDLRS